MTLKKLINTSLIIWILAVLPASSQSTFPVQNSFIFDICFSPGGVVLFIADGEQVKAYDFDQRSLVREFDSGHQAPIAALAISSDSLWLASADRSGALVIWDIRTGQIASRKNDHASGVTGVDFSPAGDLLATSGEDGKVWVYSLPGWEPYATFSTHEGDVRAVRFSPDGNLLASGGADSQVILYDVLQKKTLTTLQGHRSWVRDLDFNTAGTILSSVGDDGRVFHWNITNPQHARLRNSIRIMPHWITSIRYINNNTILVANTRGLIRILSPTHNMQSRIKRPVHRAIARPDSEGWITVVVATRGNGVMVISGLDMKVR